MADREKKGGRRKYKNLNLANEESFLDEIKSIFHNYLRAIIWWKYENYRTQALILRAPVLRD